MELSVVSIGPSPRAREPFHELVQVYLRRCSPFAPCQEQSFRSEAALFQWVDRRAGRTTPTLVLLDSRGRTYSSEAFAQWVGQWRDSGGQSLIFAVGPADGWSGQALKRANLTLSLGPMTLAHDLARLVLAEQIYRAFTILSGHPYHTGH